MSKKREEKLGDSRQDADLEISDEELKKVSGGVGVRGVRGVRVAHREDPGGNIRLGDHPFRGKRPR